MLPVHSRQVFLISSFKMKFKTWRVFMMWCKKKKKTTLTCSTRLTEKKVTTQKKSGGICSRKKENTDLQNWQEEKKHNNENMSEDEHCQDDGDATTGGNLRVIVCGSHRRLLFHIHRPHKIICFARKWDEGTERHSPGSWGSQRALFVMELGVSSAPPGRPGCAAEGPHTDWAMQPEPATSSDAQRRRMLPNYFFWNPNLQQIPVKLKWRRKVKTRLRTC